MSSHRRRVKTFSRATGPRKALLRGLITSLVEHGRIKTTVDRAKEARRHVEKLVTLGKKGDLATRRLAISRLANVEAVAQIFDSIAPRFKTRPGGYTRVIKIGRRPGDTAEMAFLEFVDFNYEDKSTKSDSVDKTESKKAKAPVLNKAVAAKKKTTKKLQKKARAAARA